MSFCCSESLLNRLPAGSLKATLQALNDSNVEVAFDTWARRRSVAHDGLQAAATLALVGPPAQAAEQAAPLKLWVWGTLLSFTPPIIFNNCMIYTVMHNILWYVV